MEEAARRFAFGRREERAWPQEEEEERRQLRESLVQTRILIHQAYAGFNSTGDSDLIDSYVFEIKALQSRYSYLLRRVKELDGPGTPEPAAELLDAWESAVK